MPQYLWKLECPRCGRESETMTVNADTDPVVNCGDCLMDDTEVVKFRVISVSEDNASDRNAS